MNAHFSLVVQKISAKGFLFFICRNTESVTNLCSILKSALNVEYRGK